MRFEKPQTTWLQNALTDTFGVFGDHAEQRLKTVEAEVTAMSEKVENSQGKFAEVDVLKDQVSFLKTEREAVKNGMASGSPDSGPWEEQLTQLRQKIEQQATQMAEQTQVLGHQVTCCHRLLGLCH